MAACSVQTEEGNSNKNLSEFTGTLFHKNGSKTQNKKRT